MKQILFLFFCLLPVLPQALTNYWNKSSPLLPPSCKSEIFCESEFLHDVQVGGVFGDSKHFVDMKMKYTELEIKSNYTRLKQLYNDQVPPKDVLASFVHENMVMGDDLVNWTIPDFVARPPLIDQINDPAYSQWAIELNDLWMSLAKKVKDDVRTNQDMYSVIWVPNGFIVPGGRFREMYYWDTYWIVKGLLLCGMNDTARGIIDNLVSMVDRFGYVPNGGRVYYLNRSQPSMLTPMVDSYFKATGDFDYVLQVLPSLMAELDFWAEHRFFEFEKDGRWYRMARYYAPSRGPRPESYREDFINGQRFDTQDKVDEFYINMKSGAESGWDFSGRWYINNNGSNTGELYDIKTSNIVPVDLNSILQMNARKLCSWLTQIGNHTDASRFCTMEKNLMINIREVLWRPDKGIWFDYDMKNNKHREYFYVSNMLPLWTESYETPKNETAELVMKYLIDQRIIGSDYSILYNGIPTSMDWTYQQWDFPNSWPSLQAFAIQGLYNTQNPNAQQLAIRIADFWLRFSFNLYKRKSRMFEKYQVTNDEEIATGGEYPTQTGFGWTNGVVLELLSQFGDTITHN